MFDNLTDKLGSIFSLIKKRGHLTETDVNNSIREIRIALLEADVNYRVVKDFCAKIKEKAVGEKVYKSLRPGDVVVKIVHDELIQLLGSINVSLKLSGNPPVIMLVGLQGSGKTTTAAKIGYYLKKENSSPLLAACDNRRPAASEQLKILAQNSDLAFSGVDIRSPLLSTEKAINKARANYKSPVILDTAGRIHIDDEMMNELKGIKEKFSPSEILLVVDAMTGQDAVQLAQSFHTSLNITGIFLTKMDGDTRGGASLSMRAVTGVPIKFIGTGEKIENLEVFYPDRMASRILGMGDIVTLVEKVQRVTEEEDAEKMVKKLKKMEFTLDDFLDQLQKIKKMGPMENIISMLPANFRKNLPAGDGVEDKELNRIESIINSMTIEERKNPKIINISRKRRVAKGSGNNVGDVSKLLKQFLATQKMMKSMLGKERNIFSYLTKKKK